MHSDNSMATSNNAYIFNQIEGAKMVAVTVLSNTIRHDYSQVIRWPAHAGIRILFFSHLCNVGLRKKFRIGDGTSVSVSGNVACRLRYVNESDTRLLRYFSRH